MAAPTLGTAHPAWGIRNDTWRNGMTAELREIATERETDELSGIVLLLTVVLLLSVLVAVTL